MEKKTHEFFFPNKSSKNIGQWKKQLIGFLHIKNHFIIILNNLLKKNYPITMSTSNKDFKVCKQCVMDSSDINLTLDSNDFWEFTLANPNSEMGSVVDILDILRNLATAGGGLDLTRKSHQYIGC
jgi:hypothetical protein